MLSQLQNLAELDEKIDLSQGPKTQKKPTDNKGVAFETADTEIGTSSDVAFFVRRPSVMPKEKRVSRQFLLVTGPAGDRRRNEAAVQPSRGGTHPLAGW